MTLAFSSPAPAANPVVRAATRADVEQIWELITCYVAEGLMLPRTVEQVTMAIDNYVVAAQGSRVVACAALDETNLVVCKLARERFNVTTTIARLRSPEFQDDQAPDLPVTLKTSGSRGIHLVFPLPANTSYDTSLQLAELVARAATVGRRRPRS